MRALFYKACLVALGALCCAQALLAEAKPGFLFYVTDYGVTARLLEFTDFGDYKKEGIAIPVATKGGEVIKIPQDFVFDVVYFSEIFPEDIQTSEDITGLNAKIKKLSALQSKYPGSSQKLGEYVDQINGDIASFGAGKRKINGKWLSAAEVAAIEAKKQKDTEELKNKKVITKDGKVYSGVSDIEVKGNAVVVIYQSGIVRIPLDNISDETKSAYTRIAMAVLEGQKPPKQENKVLDQAAHAPMVSDKFTGSDIFQDKMTPSNSWSREQFAKEFQDAQAQLDSLHEKIQKLKSELHASDKSSPLSAVSPGQFVIQKKLSFTKFPQLKMYGDEIYQVSCSDIGIAILITNETSYSSSGRAWPYVRLGGEVPVTMDDGFDRKVLFYVEASKAEVLLIQEDARTKSKIEHLESEAKDILKTIKE